MAIFFRSAHFATINSKEKDYKQNLRQHLTKRCSFFHCTYFTGDAFHRADHRASNKNEERQRRRRRYGHES